MSRLDRALSRIYAVLGSVVFVCFFTYFVKLIFSPEAYLPYFVCALVLAVTALPYVFRVRLRRLLGQAFVPLKAVMCAGFAVYVVTFAALVSYIYLSPVAHVDALATDTERVYIVFGAKIKPDGPTATLAARLDTAADALREDKTAVCIVTGGQGPDEVEPEAECMKRYLVECGIDAERIYTETDASNTRENILCSKELIEREGLGEREVICVSSDTHIPRISLMCSREGLDARFIKAPSPKKQFLFTTLVREHLSYVKMFLMGG